MTTARKHAAWVLIVLLIAGLFATNRIPPAANIASAIGPASGATSNTIGAVGQQVSIFVPAGGAVRVGVSGTFVGTLSFTLNQGAGPNAVNLFNLGTGSATDQSAMGTGSWYYAPTSGNDGTLIIQASAWTSGAAIVSIVDLVASSQNMDLIILPSATATSSRTGADIVNPCFKGLIAILNITAASGTGGIKVLLRAKDPVSGNYRNLVALPASAQTATGTFVVIFYPSTLSGTSADGTSQQPLPTIFDIQGSPGDSTSYTYSIAISLMR